jgi:hypothetical protein
MAAAGPGGPGGGIGFDPGDPLGALAGGSVGSDPNLPVTDGLSVGPGAVPYADQAADPLQERLLAMAQEAESPRLRAVARAALRQHVRAKQRGQA